MLAWVVRGVGVGVIAGLAMLSIGCARDNPEFGAVAAGGGGFGASDGSTSGAASTSAAASTGGPGEGSGVETVGVCHT